MALQRGGKAMGYTEGWNVGGLYRGVERGSTGAWEGGVEIIVEKFGKRWNKMEKYS